MAKQKDGRYRAKVTVGYDADGQPVVKYASGRTKKELEAAKAELKKRYVGGVEIRRNVLVSEYLTDWFEVCKRPNISMSTAQNYSTALGRILSRIGDKRMAAVTAIDLQALMNSLSGSSKTFVTDVRSILRNSFRLALSEGVIDRDITAALKMPSTRQKEHRRALTAAETAAVLKVAQEHPYGLLLSLLYYTGMRRGEAIGLRWSDIDFASGMIHVRRSIDYTINAPSSTKTECSNRDIPMPTALKTALKAVQVKGMSYVIQGERTGEHMPQPTYVRHWKELMAAVYAADPSIESTDLNAGAKDAAPLIGSVLTAHYFRHNYASILYNSGVDVLTAQKYLGHSDPSTTLRIYTHLAEETEEKDRMKVMSIFDSK